MRRHERKLVALVAVGALLFFALRTPAGRAAIPGAQPDRPKPRPSPGGGRMLTLVELRELAVRHGFPDPDTAAAVAMAESRGRPDAANVVTNPKPGNLPERSFGLWQINTLVHREYDEQRLLDPEYNAQAALAISSGGTVWRWWSTYSDGTYRRFMPPAPVPVAGPDDPPDYPFVDDDEETDPEGRGLDS